MAEETNALATSTHHSPLASSCLSIIHTEDTPQQTEQRIHQLQIPKMVPTHKLLTRDPPLVPVFLFQGAWE